MLGLMGTGDSIPFLPSWVNLALESKYSVLWRPWICSMMVIGDDAHFQEHLIFS